MPKSKIEIQTTEQLFERARKLRLNGAVFWKYVGELRNRPTRATFAAARLLCLSHREHDRVLGANVLCQLRKVWKENGTYTKSKLVFAADSQKLIRPMLRDSRTEVVRTAIYALGHLDDPQRSRQLSRFANHRNPDLRYAVAFALGGDSHPLSVRTLISLMEDRDRDVRNWATFGLGALGDPKKADTPRIREALLKRLDDPYHDAHGEALVGLAMRKDVRVIDIIQRELHGKNPSTFALDAAYEFGNPVFYPALRKLWRGIRRHGKTHSTWCTNLKYALKTCAPRKAQMRSA